MKSLIAAYLFCNVVAVGWVVASPSAAPVAFGEFCPNCGWELPDVEVAQDDVTGAEWVVIFEVPPDIKPPQLVGPALNLRVVIRADREGNAILKAIRHLQNILDARAFDRMTFVEAQERAPQK